VPGLPGLIFFATLIRSTNKPERSPLIPVRLHAMEILAGRAFGYDIHRFEFSLIQLFYAVGKNDME